MHVHIYTCIYTYQTYGVLCIYCFPSHAFTDGPYFLHLQCSGSAVVPSFAVLTSCRRYISGRLPGYVPVKSTYTGLQCLLHRLQSSQPSLLRGWLCSVNQGQPYHPARNTSLLCIKADKM